MGIPTGELVKQIKENPYYQFFIGFPGYQNNQPFAPSLLVEFRKRLSNDVMMAINEMIIAYNTPDNLNCIVHSGDKCSPDSGSFITPIIDIAIIKLPV